MNGLKIIIFSIVGTAITVALLLVFGWYFGNEYISNDREVKDVLQQIDIISQFPEILKSNETEIQNVLTLIDILDRPKTTEFISKLNTGLVSTLDVPAYLNTALTKVKAGINEEITGVTDNLTSDIRREIRASLQRILAEVRSIFPW
jgi:hypothetical protein